jgi:small subunit ribosomal protein S6
MRDYETVFILDPNLEEDDIKDEIGKVENSIASLNGEITSVEPGGKRRLTYEIKGYKEGYYTLIRFRSEPASIVEIERAYKLNEKVIRHIIVHSVQKVVQASEEEQQAEA